jgi:hypothetical protein
MSDLADQPLAKAALEYGQAPPRLRRRLLKVAALLALIAIGAAAYHWRAPIRHRVMEYYWFSRAMSHVTPPGTVLAERDPVKAQRLIASDSSYFDRNTYLPLLPANAVTPIAYRLRTPPKPLAIYVPPEMRQLEAFIQTSSNDFADPATVFLGERRTPSGRRRLVIIRGAMPTVSLLAHLTGSVIETPGLTHGARWLNRAQSFSYSGPATVATLSPGVADPADRSHLTINYAVNGSKQAGVIDVHLLDDDTLAFALRPQGK